MRSLLISMLIFSAGASAQWGTGQWGAQNCNQPYEPAPQSYAAADELSNIRGDMRRDNQTLQEREAELSRLSSRVDDARRRMQRVLSPEALRAVEEHQAQRRHRNDYRESCAPGAGGDANQVPVPPGFCVAEPPPPAQPHYNMWDRMVHETEHGKMSDKVCRSFVPYRGPDARPEANDVRDCIAGLNDFYAVAGDRARLTDEINGLRNRVRGYESRIGGINREVAEGRYCSDCASQRRGYSTGSTGDQMMNMVGPLFAIGAALLSRGNQRRQPPPTAPYGYGPPMVAGPQPYRAFPARPYAARTPGYYGTHNGVYGAVPGSIGRGAFGCNNTSPHAFGDPMFGNDYAPIFDGPSPFDAPYARPFMNPVAQNRMFNPGFGPGFQPRLGGRQGPPTMPFMRGGMQQGPLAWQNRMPMTQMPGRFGMPRPGFGFGQAPVTAPFMRGGMPNQFGGINQMFPGYPQASLLNQYYGGNQFFGGNQFYGAPAVAGYTGGPLTSVSNVPGIQYNYLGNFTHQMNQISNNIMMLGSGSYYNPPVTMPFVGGTTSLPGTTINPVGGGTVLPVGGGTAIPPTSPATGPGVVPPKKK